MTDQGGRSGCRDEDGATFGGRPLRAWRLVRCSGCGLPTDRCLCATLPSLAVRTRVLVVTHRVEAMRSTNTARLAMRMLSGASTVVRGEANAGAPEGRRLVLFPFEDARPLSPDDLGDDLTLVVPDGTWSQARRIARRDDLAKGAASVTIPLRDSAYGLRRNPRPGALCTLEAIAEALRVLEGDAVAEALLEAFVRWRDLSLAVREGRG